MNLILFHLTEKKFDLISLRLFSSSVSFHLMKKNLVLFHLMKIKSGSVSFHQKKISSRPGPDPGQDRTRTGNPGPCGQPTCICPMAAMACHTRVENPIANFLDSFCCTIHLSVRIRRVRQPFKKTCSSIIYLENLS